VHDSTPMIAITFAEVMLFIDDVVAIFVDVLELIVVYINMISYITCHDGYNSSLLVVL
jgi:hypothetical protein